MITNSNASRIRERRVSLGLSTTQLAYRLGISQSSVVRLEQSEKRGVITLASLRRAAESLGCELVYRLKPKRNSHSRQSNKRYYGRVRIRKAHALRAQSRAHSELLREEIQMLRFLTPKQKLYAAFELSSLTLKLNQCSSKPS